MRLIFAGTPAFAVPTLDALRRARHEIVAVYTRPDRPAGRGRRETASPIKQFALAHALPLRQPASLRSETEAIAALHADAMIVVAYGLLLPSAILESPRRGCINVHASLLPRWRGAAPIARAIEAGDTETGVTIMQMEAGLDTGPILAHTPIPIAPDATAATLHDVLAVRGAELLVVTLDAIARGEVAPRAQDARHACYAAKLTKPEAAIDWRLPAAELHRKVRAFNPYPVANTSWHGDGVRIWDVAPLAVAAGPVAAPGTIVRLDAHAIGVATGAGVLDVTRVQPAGGTVIAAGAFANGRRLKLGDRFGS